MDPQIRLVNYIRCHWQHARLLSHLHVNGWQMIHASLLHLIPENNLLEIQSPFLLSCYVHTGHHPALYTEDIRCWMQWPRGFKRLRATENNSVDPESMLAAMT